MPLGDHLGGPIADAVNFYFDGGDQTKGNNSLSFFRDHSTQTGRQKLTKLRTSLHWWIAHSSMEEKRDNCCRAQHGGGT
jgi:hypothetical protein